MNFIASAQNNQFKNLKALQLKKHRYRQNRFILEGKRFVFDALKLGWSCDGIYFEEQTWELLDIEAQVQFEKLAQVNVLSMELFEKISETEHSQGLVGIFMMPNPPKLEALNGKFLIYLDRLQDPGNLGTIIRTADAAGVDAVILNKGCVDVFNSKTLRSTAGSILNVKILLNAEDDSLLPALKTEGYRIIVTDLESNYDYNENEAYGPKNCLVIGNEGNGVSDEVKALADVRVKIPIYGKAESLNASIAAGIMIYKIRTIL